MEKRQINNISAVGIIFRESNPVELFIEMKDDGHPIKLVRRQLCLIGGNWIGESAKNDRNTLETLRREIREELSLDKGMVDPKELELLGLADSGASYETSSRNRTPTREEQETLEELKLAMMRGYPFGDFINTVPKEVLDKADPENKRGGFSGLSSYWIIPLQEPDWKKLINLQNDFGNLSNESITLVTSLDDIIEKRRKTAFGHDRALQRFFLDFGVKRAKHLPLVEGITSEDAGTPLGSYAQYLMRYDVAKKPV